MTTHIRITRVGRNGEELGVVASWVRTTPEMFVTVAHMLDGTVKLVAEGMGAAVTIPAGQLLELKITQEAG